MAREFSGYQCI